jgi:hypothetical protein
LARVSAPGIFLEHERVLMEFLPLPADFLSNGPEDPFVSWLLQEDTMDDQTKRYRVALRENVEVAMRHAAIARRVTVSDLIAIAVSDLVERDGWLASPAEAGAPQGGAR